MSTVLGRLTSSVISSDGVPANWDVLRLSRYWPPGRFWNVYFPLASVIAVTRTPDPTFSRMTVAFESVLPACVCTVPEMLPFCP